MATHKLFSIGCLLLAMAHVFACATVERAGFDNTSHSVRYCGNKHADQADVESAARHDCSAAQRFAVLRCEREQVGAKAATFGYGGGVAFTSSRATYGVCCDVSCGN
jgi:hypothetical protein